MKICKFLLAALCVGVHAGLAQIPYPGNDSDQGVTRPHGLIDPYTGNTAFAANDLSVKGAVGEYRLSWSRYATSRTASTAALFGLGHNWSHSWQWEMVYSGQDSQGRSLVSVQEPWGKVVQFTETSAGEWWPAPSVKERIVVDGTNYRLLRDDQGEVDFSLNNSANGPAFTPTQMVDGLGNSWTLAWQNGQLVQITEPAGRWLAIAYSTLTASDGGTFTVIASVTASDGQVVTYNYTFPDGADYPVLTGVTYPDGTHGSYSYDTAQPNTRVLLTQASDPHADNKVRGRAFVYHSEPGTAQGQVSEVDRATDGAPMDKLAADGSDSRSYAIVDSQSAQHQTYNPGGNSAQEVDALGFATQQTYDADGRGFRIGKTDPLGRTTQFANDSDGNVVEQTLSDGNKITCTRDERGRILSRTDQLGNTTGYSYDDSGRLFQTQLPDGRVIQAAYNDFGQPTSIVDPAGNLTTAQYDQSGLRTQVTNALGSSVAYAYDTDDRVSAATDPLGHTVQYERDAAGRVVKRTYADGASTQTTYNDFGQPISQTDASGAARTFAYDDFGRVIATVDPLGGETQFEYDNAAQTGAAFQHPSKIIDAEGRTKTLTYDAKGRLASFTVADGTTDARTKYITYDTSGHVAQKSDSLGDTKQYFYDDFGRVIKAVDAVGNAKSFTYDADGHKTSMTDGKGNTTTWIYNSVGQRIATVDALGRTTKYDYDTSGRLIFLTDAKGSTYQFQYDALGHQTALIYPDRSSETSTYDSAGNVLTYTNRAGVTRRYTYDNRNREVRSDWSDAGLAPLTKAYDVVGRMTLEDNGVSKLTYNYDAAGHLLAETQDLSETGLPGATAHSVSYTYDAMKHRQSLTYPDRSLIKYTYNDAGSLQQILDGSTQALLAGYNYDEAGHLESIDGGDGAETLIAYDADKRITEILEQNPDGNLLSQQDYTYDENGNRVSTTTYGYFDGTGTLQVTKDTYSYDEVNEVTGADYEAPVHGDQAGQPASQESFNYDEVGNRTQSTRNGVAKNYAVNNLNQYTSVDGTAPVYSRNGDLIRLGSWSYAYDALNRLVSASNGQMSARFYYDAKNRCVARSYNGDATFNYYDRWNLIEEYGSDGQPVAKYVYGHKVDSIIQISNQYGTFRPHYDVLGNVTFLTDSAGKLVERYTYSVTGNVTITDGGGNLVSAAGDGKFSRSTVGNRWMYTGREWLPEIGLYDYRNRVYSPELGRFMQTDPLRFAAGDINIYRYVGNNYLNAVDPFGLWVPPTHPGTEGEVADVIIGAVDGMFVGGAGGAIGGAVVGSIAGPVGTGTGAIAGGIRGAITGAISGAIAGAARAAASQGGASKSQSGGGK